MATTTNQSDNPNGELPDGITVEWLTRVCQLLGLDADTDPDTILGAVADVVASENDGTTDEQPSQVVASAKRLGMEMIDADSLAALRRDAAEGRKQVAAAARTQRETAVDSAIRDGKITPARRDHWLKLLEADPAMGDVLASTPPQTAVPLTPIGHSLGEDADGAASAPAWFR